MKTNKKLTTTAFCKNTIKLFVIKNAKSTTFLQQIIGGSLLLVLI